MDLTTECGKAEWFKNWFDSPYYHLLYSNRDEEEAEMFMRNIVAYLQLPSHSKIWDLACGKGRHAIQLNKLGNAVVGTDLAVNSISEALKYQNRNLDFYVHDMRTPFRLNYFDAVFNLFTSIGYFIDYRDNFKVFEHAYNALKPGGYFVIDFLNATHVKNHLVPESRTERNGCEFRIKKHIADEKVFKRIDFEAENKPFYFEEVVSLFQEKDFDDFANAAGFKKTSVFGDYHLNPLNQQSDRLIIIYTKL
jgi:SAM-dependent methyltransferase